MEQPLLERLGETAAPLPETLRVSARPRAGERATREKNARSQLEEGRKALADRQFDAAISALQSAITASGRGDYGVQPNEAASMLRQARNSKAAAEATQRHANAQRLVEEAKALGSWTKPRRFQKLREARNLDPDIEGATELTNSLGEQARAQGESALTSARTSTAAAEPNRRSRNTTAPCASWRWCLEVTRISHPHDNASRS